MIFNESEYNPMPAIVKILATVPKGGLITSTKFDEMRKELFTAGIVPENKEELNKVLKCLMETVNGK